MVCAHVHVAMVFISMVCTHVHISMMCVHMYMHPWCVKPMVCTRVHVSMVIYLCETVFIWIP